MSNGGNKRFYEFITPYKINSKPLLEKYNHIAAQYYKLKLRSEVDGTDFDLKPPSTKEWVIMANKVKGAVEKGVVQGADWVKDKWQKSGIEGKVKDKWEKSNLT